MDNLSVVRCGAVRTAESDTTLYSMMGMDGGGLFKKCGVVGCVIDVIT
jgi:hypothetical protein